MWSALVYTKGFGELVAHRLRVCVSHILGPSPVLAVLGLGELTYALHCPLPTLTLQLAVEKKNEGYPDDSQIYVSSYDLYTEFQT